MAFYRNYLEPFKKTKKVFFYNHNKKKKGIYIHTHIPTNNLNSCFGTNVGKKFWVTFKDAQKSWFD